MTCDIDGHQSCLHKELATLSRDCAPTPAAEAHQTEIDTPEAGQPWGNRARQALADKVFRKLVRVEVVDVDRYDRKVGKIWLGDRDINRELVREGHAWVYRRYMTDRTLLDDERAAQAVSAGLWALPEPVAPWEWRRGQRSTETVSDAPGACNIKGNINREGTRIYHMPGRQHYDQTQIDTTKGERWFCSPREAELAGWRAAR